MAINKPKFQVSPRINHRKKLKNNTRAHFPPLSSSNFPPPIISLDDKSSSGVLHHKSQNETIFILPHKLPSVNRSPYIDPTFSYRHHFYMKKKTKEKRLIAMVQETITKTAFGLCNKCPIFSP